MNLDKLNDEITSYYHLKYGFSLSMIQNLWFMSKDADELNRNCETAISLNKTLMGMRR